ncbi:hypothetical protein C8R42DRAFT_728338 [Lentinula raphanica]|nr:hypothetical protein C8R42DRAFT_728338 [Lentinula raphanica]
MSSFFRLVCILLCVAPTLTGSSLSPRVCVNDVQSKACGLSDSSHLCSRDIGSGSVLLTTRGSDQFGQKELKPRAPGEHREDSVADITITIENAEVSEQSLDKLSSKDYKVIMKSNIKSMVREAFSKWGDRRTLKFNRWVNFPSRSRPSRCSFKLDKRMNGVDLRGMLELSYEDETFMISGFLQAQPGNVVRYDNTMTWSNNDVCVRSLYAFWPHNVFLKKDNTQPKKEPLPTIPEHAENPN